MEKIAILADSSQDINFEIADRYGLRVIPYCMTIDDKSYTDLIDITGKQFYEKIKTAKNLSTGVPSIKSLTDVIDGFVAEGYTDIIAFTTGAKMTGMFSLYGLIKASYSNINIHVVDTESAASGAGLMSIYAAKLRDEGNTVEEIISKVERAKEKSKVFALFRTLKYLVKGGRFGKFTGMIGTLLAINPLLTIDDGEVNVLVKARGKKKSMQELENAVRKQIGDNKKYYLAIFHAANNEELLELKERLSDLISGAELYIETELNPVLGVHSGPNAIGAAVAIIE